MKKTITALVAITTFVIACSPKVTSTATGTGSAEAGGALISSAKCTKCHKDQTAHVASHTYDEQEKLMHTMAKKARLSPEETADLLAYVKANAKQ